MRNALAKAVKGLKKGDPKSEDTFIGPLIAEKEAERVESWIQEAVSKGASSQQIQALYPGKDPAKCGWDERMFVSYQTDLY